MKTTETFVGAMINRHDYYNTPLTDPQDIIDYVYDVVSVYFGTIPPGPTRTQIFKALHDWAGWTIGTDNYFRREEAGEMRGGGEGI